MPGGGTALLYASMCLDGMKMENFDQEVGVKIVRNAIRVPCQTIADNSGMEGVYRGGERGGRGDDEVFGYPGEEGGKRL